MENPIPAPPSDYGYLITFMVAILSLGTLVIGFGVREYLKYRDRRDQEDRDFRDKQVLTQEQHYKDVSESRENFRRNYEATTNERLDGFESTIKAIGTEFRAILEAQQKQINALDKELYRLTHKSPKEGE